MNVKPNDNDNLSLMFCYRKKNAIFTSLPIQPSDGNIPCLEQKTQKITKSNTTHQLRCLTAESNRQKKLEFYKSK